MKIEDILPDDIKARLEKLRAKILKGEEAAFEKEMLANPEVRKEYDRLESKYKKIRKQLNKKRKENK